jgi:hypothetical protein
LFERLVFIVTNDAFTTAENTQQQPVPPPPVDATVEVILADRGMRAYLLLTSPQNGGAALNEQQLADALAAQGVKTGIQQDILAKTASEPEYGQKILIAEGVPPLHGGNGSYELQFEAENELKPKVRADGSVDFYDLGLVTNVREGQVLCTITLPTDGTDGVTVTGEVAPAKKGRPVPTMTGKNTKLSEDGLQITAAVSGYVDFAMHKINVNDTLFIKEDVDNSTGSIKTPSNVVISGTVSSGFSVESEGNVQVGAAISGAKIKAGGNLVLKRGSTGCKLECEGDLTTRYMENCDVFAKGSIKSDYIMNCNIKCAKSIQVGGPIAKIVGGSCIAGEDIVARTIGSSAGIRTYLEIGTDPEMIRRQQALVEQIPQWEAKMASLQSLLKLFEQYEAAGRLTPDKKQAYQDAMYSYKTSSELLEKGSQELEVIEEEIKKRGYGRIVCKGTIYPGTCVKIGGTRMLVSAPMSNRALSYGDDNIIDSPAG